MMSDPYLTLGINEQVTDEAVTAAYHKKLRAFPPEEHPEAFARISEAYEAIRTEQDRVDLRLFDDFPEPERVAELAANEAPEPPRVERAHWQAFSTRAWLTGRMS